MTPPASSRDRTRRAQRSGLPRTVWAIDLGFVAVIAAAGLVAAWPIYRDPWMFLTAGGGLAAGAVIAVLATRRRWTWWVVTLWGAAAYAVLGIPLGAPRALTDLGELPSAAMAVLTAPVTGWKNLLTLDLPVGTYQAVLAPLLLVYLIIPLVALSIAWRTRRWVLAIPVTVVMPAFGTVFGSTTVRGILDLGPLVVPGAVELFTGIAVLLALVGWYVWRTAAARMLDLRTAQDATGLRVRRPSGAAASKWLLAGGMVAVAVIVGVVAAPLALAGEAREVPRAQVEPELRIRSELSPLSTYREYVTDLYDTDLFRVQTDADSDRVRLATLSFYDGVVARVLDPSGADPAATAFVRLPGSLSTAADAVRSRVEIDAYTGIWVPIVGDLTSVAFAGPERGELADQFFFNANAGMAVELADPGLVTGVSIDQTSTPSAGDREALVGEPRLDEDVVPASLTDWIDAQNVEPGYPGLLTLIDRLRARGYLSHALSIDESDPPAWMTALGDYTFEPSRAGHSTGRIDALFTALLERQNKVGGEDDALLVSAVGDDEQFAVAAALLADQMGLHSRIVLGARLSADADGALAACEAGVCRGSDVSAWIEVRDTAGGWIPVDTTPQHLNPIAPDIDQRNDPLIPTEVQPQQAEVVPPPDAAPADSGETDPAATEETVDLTALWSALRATGGILLVLLILLGPFLAIILAKAMRSRSRRGSVDPADQVIGGWDEYVDAAVDRGLALPRSQTRSELAALYDTRGTGAAIALATWADRSAFAYEAPTDAESVAFWQLVDAERRQLTSDLGWWARLRARVSLRSFRRAISAGRDATRTQRRRTGAPAQTRTTRMTRTASSKEAQG